MTKLHIRITESERREFAIAASAGGGNMSSRLRVLMRAYVRTQKEQFPRLFNLDTPEEECALEAIEEGNSTLRQIAIYARLDARTAKRVLLDLIARRKVVHVPVERPNQMTPRGRPRFIYKLRRDDARKTQ